MRLGRDGLRDLVQVQGHALGRAAGQDQPRSFAVSRADGAEDVGRGGPLILGAEGRVPRLAQRRVILFFCPIRASSANQISSGLPPTACRISSTQAGKFF